MAKAFLMLLPGICLHKLVIDFEAEIRARKMDNNKLKKKLPKIASPAEFWNEIFRLQLFSPPNQTIGRVDE